MEVGLVNNIPEMEAGLMKNIAAFLMRAGFYNKLILYTLRRIVREELSRRIVRAELSCAELSSPNCPLRIVLRRIVRTPPLAIFLQLFHSKLKTPADPILLTLPCSPSQLRTSSIITI